MKIPIVDSLAERFPRTGICAGVAALWSLAGRLADSAGWPSGLYWPAPVFVVALFALLLLNSAHEQ